MLFLKTHFNACESIFCILREIALHNPVVISRIGSEHLLGQTTFLFAEIDYFALIVIVYQASEQIDIPVGIGEL